MTFRFKSLFSRSSSIPDHLPRGRSFDPPISSADYVQPQPQPQPQPQSQSQPQLPQLPQSQVPHDERPSTAPDNGRNSGRTRARSGFSMKSPPAVLASNRKNSVASTRRRNSIWSIRSTPEAPPPVPSFPNLASLPPLPQSPAVGGFTPSVSTLSPPPTPDLPRPYVDLLAAHSAITNAGQRSRPLAVRDYSEDVADRNIALGEKAPEKPRPKHLGILVQGDDGMRFGEAQQNDAPPSPRTTSIRSFTGPRSGIAYPPRSDSLRSVQTASASSVSGDERVIPSMVVQDRRGHTMSPLSSPATPVFKDSSSQVPPPRASPTRAAPSPESSEQARPSSPSAATVTSTSLSKALPPLPSGTPSRRSSTPSSQLMASLSDSRRAQSPAEEEGSTPLTSIGSRDDALPAKSLGEATHYTTDSSSNRSFSTADESRSPRTTSPHSMSTRASRERSYSRDGSVNRSAPSYASRENQQRGYTGNGGIHALASMWGHENPGETDVTTNVAPAVQHEEVIIKTENVQHEVVTIESHTHEYRHRILPVIETEILPTKHYTQSEDGKPPVEIPESLVRQLSLGDPEAYDRHVAPRSRSHKSTHDSEHTNSPPAEAAASPIISLAQDDAKTHSRRNSGARSVKAKKPPRSDRSTRSRAKSLFEPILASKKEYMKEEGYPRTEYVWHHEPVIKTDDDQPHPIYIGAGLGDLGSQVHSNDKEDDQPHPIYIGAGLGDLSSQVYSSDEDLAGARFGAEAARGGLFAESGLEAPKSLPGLAKQLSYDEMYGARETDFLTKQ